MKFITFHTDIVLGVSYSVPIRHWCNNMITANIGNPVKKFLNCNNIKVLLYNNIKCFNAIYKTEKKIDSTAKV